MPALLLEGTEQTPKIKLDADAGIFEIAGRSLPPSAIEFYTPVLRWIEEYAARPNGETLLTFRFEYINSGSSKMILDLLFILQKIAGARVVWYFPEDDEDMEETGEDFAQLVSLPFELKAF